MEFLRPGEILAEQKRCSIVYLPVGPLEWHGPAMPFGTDPLAAQALAREAALRTGGVVAPTLFFGTERERPAWILETKGFEHADEMYVLGMDVPKNSLKSFYAREEIFALMIREQLRFLTEHGYRLVVILNGHGAWGQKSSLDRLAIEFSHETASRVIVCFPDINGPDEQVDFGHGTMAETSIMRYVDDRNVALSELPPREVPLKYTDWGIADDSVFAGKRSPGDSVIVDPRDATPEKGARFFKNALERICGEVGKAYSAL